MGLCFYVVTRRVPPTQFSLPSLRRSALGAVDAVDAAVLDYVRDTAGKHSTETETDHSVSLPVALLMYDGIRVSEQVRVLFAATARSLLQKDVRALSMIEAKVAEVSALGPKLSAEDVVALVLNGRKGGDLDLGARSVVVGSGGGGEGPALTEVAIDA